MFSTALCTDPPLPVVDRLGHARPAYCGLLVYAWAMSLRHFQEQAAGECLDRHLKYLRVWCDRLCAGMASVSKATGEWPAARGAEAASLAWSARALDAAGSLFANDRWHSLARDTFDSLRRLQRPTGAFLAASRADNPETYWYHELVLLHALAGFAAVHRDDQLLAAAAANADFHLAETQPDHATGQPWGLTAFILHEPANLLADELLHTAATRQNAGPDGIARMLLADALYCSRLHL